jgi:hypothetical protein
VDHKWTDDDEKQLMKIKNNEVDNSETYLGTVAAITSEEWESVKRMREADDLEVTNLELANVNGNNAGALGAENGANGVSSSWKQCKPRLVINRTLFLCAYYSV